MRCTAGKCLLDCAREQFCELTSMQAAAVAATAAMGGRSTRSSDGGAAGRRQPSRGKSSGRSTPTGRTASASAKRRPQPQRASQRSVGPVSYAESDDDLSEEDRGPRGGSKPKKEPLPAFDDPKQFDDEVERVITHRCGEASSLHVE